MKLFCFPYAGGSSLIYKKWSGHNKSGIHIRPIELAGRGTRMNEPLYKNFSEVVDDLFEKVAREIDGGDYAFFGHSLGSKIAYELTIHLIRKKLPSPKHIFFSGRGAPYTAGKKVKKYYSLSDEEFKEELIKFGGTPKEFFDSPELMEIFLPLLRNDFSLAEREIDGKVIRPLDCDITIFLGKDEDLTPSQITTWKDYSRGNCCVIFVNGGHFFIHEKMDELLVMIHHILLPLH